jgi:hypothetical protein
VGGGDDQIIRFDFVQNSRDVAQLGHEFDLRIAFDLA